MASTKNIRNLYLLFAVSKRGEIKSWKCDIEKEKDGSASLIITTKAGEDYKEVVRKDTITQGKNIGRSNETTPYEQAAFEAASRYNEKLREGYTITKPVIGQTSNLNSLGFKQPMLAHPIDKVKEITFPCFIQPKLDGHRAIVTMNKDGDLIMYSRKGTIISTMDHILAPLKGHLKKDQYLDGELYIHNIKLQDVSRLIKKYRPGESEKVEYWIYDMISDAPFSKRLKELRALKLIKRPILTLRTYIIRDNSDTNSIDYYTTTFLKAGYEGAIVRLDDHGYEDGKRSYNLLKVKKFDDDEYKVVDIVPGKHIQLGTNSYTPGILVCETNGNRFETYAPGQMAEKEQILKNKNKYIGKLVTIKHSGLTKDKIPFHPVAIRFHETL